jgi:hypothetical protein
MQINPTGIPSTDLGRTPITDQPVMVVTHIDQMKNLPPSESTDMLRRAGGGVVVEIQKDGYQPYKGVLNTKPGETMVHPIKLMPVSQPEFGIGRAAAGSVGNRNTKGTSLD